MIRRNHRIALFGVLGLALGVPVAAEAQWNARVQVDWEWGDGIHRARFDRAYRTAWLPRVGAPDPGYLYRPVGGVWIPPGHRPSRGFCRLWYPGVAPGHQPRPVRCHRLRGLYRPGVLVVTWQGPMRPVWDHYTDVYWVGSGDLAAVGGHGQAYVVAASGWWDVRPPRDVRPLPRVRTPRVVRRGADRPGQPERGGGASRHGEVRSGRTDRTEEGRPVGSGRGRAGAVGRRGGP